MSYRSVWRSIYFIYREISLRCKELHGCRIFFLTAGLCLLYRHFKDTDLSGFEGDIPDLSEFEGDFFRFAKYRTKFRAAAVVTRIV